AVTPLAVAEVQAALHALPAEPDPLHGPPLRRAAGLGPGLDPVHRSGREEVVHQLPLGFGADATAPVLGEQRDADLERGRGHTTPADPAGTGALSHLDRQGRGRPPGARTPPPSGGRRASVAPAPAPSRGGSRTTGTRRARTDRRTAGRAAPA